MSKVKSWLITAMIVITCMVFSTVKADEYITFDSVTEFYDSSTASYYLVFNGHLTDGYGGDTGLDGGINIGLHPTRVTNPAVWSYTTTNDDGTFQFVIDVLYFRVGETVIVETNQDYNLGTLWIYADTVVPPEE